MIKENIIKSYFDMWLSQDFKELDNCFSKEIIYRECYGAKYIGMGEIKLWIKNMLSKQTVLQWDIKNIYSSQETFFVEWTFKAKEQKIYLFDGISKIVFHENKIILVEEYVSSTETFRPFKATN